MATSGYRDEYVTKWDTLRFSWSRSSYSIADNTSTISWSLQLISGSSGAISSSASKAWSVNINGTAYSGTNTVGIGNNTTKTLASGSTVIAHNNDGTKTFAYSFSQTFNINFSGWIGTVSGSSSGALDTLPRTSSVSTTSANVGSAVIISISRASDSFTHTLRYGYGSLSGTIVNKTSSTSYSWTIPDSFYTQIPNSKTGRGAIWCDTYSGSTLVGTSSCALDVGTNESICKPTLSPTVVDQGSVSTTLTGDTNKIIRYYNTIKVSFNASAKNSSSISSMKVTCGSSSRDSDGIMGYVDSGTFVFTVTDSRGYSASQTITKEIIDYIPLTCNLSTNPDLVDGSTANINVTVKGKYFAGSFGAVTNALTVEYRYKTNNGDYPKDSDGNEVWTSLTGAISNGEYSAQTTIEGLDYTNSYTFQARAKDKVYTGGVSTVEQVVRIVPVFDWGENDFNFNVPVHGKGGFTYDIPVLASGDCNTIMRSGKYYIGDSGSNKPGPGVNGWLTVKSHSTDTCYQEYMTRTGMKYHRLMSDGAWGAWAIEDSVTNIWSYRGVMLNSTVDGLAGHGTATITRVHNDVYRIDFMCQITTNNHGSVDVVSWGLNRDYFSTLLGVEIAPIDYAGAWTAVGASIDTAALYGYGTGFVAYEQFWLPGRMYQTDGAFGGWQSKLFPVGCRLQGVCYGKTT